MELQPELKKLVDYLAPLAADSGEGTGSPHEVTKHDWTLIGDGIERASADLSSAATHVRAAIAESKSEELSLWLEGVVVLDDDAGDLIRLAGVHARRARPERALSVVEVLQLEQLKAQTELAKSELKLADEAAKIAALISGALKHDEARKRVTDLLATLKQAQEEVEATETERAKRVAAERRGHQATASQARDEATLQKLHDVAQSDPQDQVTEPAAAPIAGGSPTTGQSAHDQAGPGAVADATAKVDKVLADLVTVVNRVLADVSDKPLRVAKPDPTHLEAAAAELRAAQGSLETARGHLGDIDGLSPSAAAFLNDLDLLTVSVLDARRSLEKVSRG